MDDNGVVGWDDVSTQDREPCFCEAALDALVPTWLKQVPSDLLATNAAPLKYRREADGGFVQYSIGLNGVDDQGKPGSLDKDWREVQSDSPRLDGGDWVWRQPGR